MMSQGETKVILPRPNIPNEEMTSLSRSTSYVDVVAILVVVELGVGKQGPSSIEEWIICLGDGDMLVYIAVWVG
jgi:ABC-type antimicrobial peptide transport system permease subunit